MSLEHMADCIIVSVCISTWCDNCGERSGRKVASLFSEVLGNTMLARILCCQYSNAKPWFYYSFTFCLVFSNLDFSFLPLFPVHPVTNSDPRQRMRSNEHSKRHSHMSCVLRCATGDHHPAHLPTNLPSEVSAVKECLVPLLDSNTNPGRSSLSIVACWPSELWIAISPSLRQVSDQLPTVSLVGPTADRTGWLALAGFTWLLARCNFSRNSLLLSVSGQRLPKIF